MQTREWLLRMVQKAVNNLLEATDAMKHKANCITVRWTPLALRLLIEIHEQFRFASRQP